MKYIVGVDESGCGALAGPLVVAATAFHADAPRVSVTWKGVRGDKELVAGDSKGLKDPAHRAALAEAIRTAAAACAVITRTAAEIDQRLFHVVFPEAIMLAASRCIERLTAVDRTLTPADIEVLVDGDLERPRLPCKVTCIAGGDKSVWQIGAASVIAKASHDDAVDAMHRDYPSWGFDRSRGYPTKEHKELLAQRGPILVHRKSYRPVRELLPGAIGIED
jgi:ribonuclease HII